MNVELRMWNFELVARRAMKNYSIKNYLASYSIFLLVSPSLLGFLSPGNGGSERGVKTIEDGRGFLYYIYFININRGGLHLFTSLLRVPLPHHHSALHPIHILRVVLRAVHRLFACYLPEERVDTVRQLQGY